MIKSMTGFGRCEIADANYKVIVEMKSVNHRYLDVNMKLPKKLSVFESAVRNLMKEYVQRGKVDIFVTYEDYAEENFALKYNEKLAGAYLKYLNQMAETFGLEKDIRVSNLSRYPDVFVMEQQEADEKELWVVIEKAVHGAVQQFVETRISEGEHLKNDLLSKLDTMLTYVNFIAEQSPQVIKVYKEKLEAKIIELFGDKQMDESRIVTEVTIFADKVCVDEEIVRLKSHIEGMKNTLILGGSIGRKLDFIAQEMNREANTILSKASDLAITDTGINLKTDKEKVREQIQNIE